MSEYTLTRGKNGLVGIYLEGSLVATHDKHTTLNGDLERYLISLDEAGHTVVENTGDFSTFAELLGDTVPNKGANTPNKGSGEQEDSMSEASRRYNLQPVRSNLED